MENQRDTNRTKCEIETTRSPVCLDGKKWKSMISNLAWVLSGAVCAGLVGCVHYSSGPPLREFAHEIPDHWVEKPESAELATALGEGSPFKPVIRTVVADLERDDSHESANYIGLLDGGEDALLARLHLIQQAKRSIDYQTFIWANDESGQLVARALVDAAKRGVKVRVLIDYIGVAKDASAMASISRAAPGLEVKVYRPMARTLERGYGETALYTLTKFKGANQRMHNKVFVVDGAIGITGGRNVENSYFNHAEVLNFKDRDVLAVGPVAEQMRTVFSDFWNHRHSVPVSSLKDVANFQAPADLTFSRLDSPTGRRLLRIEAKAREHDIVKKRLIDGLLRAGSVEFISDLPGKNGAFALNGGGHSTAHLARCLAEAQSTVWIQSPYLVLSEKGMRFFGRLRRSKPDLDIHVSTNSFGSTDSLAAYAGNVRLRDRYVQQLGFQVQEYRPHPGDLRRVLPEYDWLLRKSRASGDSSQREPFVCLHAKSLVIDDATAFVGSFNLDPRSAHLNTEAGLLIRDPAIALLLRKRIERDCSPSNSWVIAPRAISDRVIQLQMLSREVTDMSPLDVTLMESSSAYELRPGMEPVSRDHPEFYKRFRKIGIFPGSEGSLSERELKGRLLKFSTRAFDPLL